jgi:hypothetical protein
VSVGIFRLKKGDKIAIGGQHYKVAVQAKIKVTKGFPEEEVLGEAKSDTNDNQFKKVVCRMLEAKIKKLEQEENDNLCSIDSDDVLFSFDGADEVPKTLISKHVGTTNTILCFQKLLNEIKAL